MKTICVFLAIFAVLPALADTPPDSGWACAVTTADATHVTSEDKFAIHGDTIQDWDAMSNLSGKPFFVFDIVENNSEGLIAIDHEAKKYGSGSSVFAEVLMIDKTRETMRSFYMASTDTAVNLSTGVCQPY